MEFTAESKEEVSQDLLYEGSLCQSNEGGLEEIEVDAANTRELEWLHRSQLEARLRAITEAQDRLLEAVTASAWTVATKSISAVSLPTRPSRYV
jgi:hypothetical protein